MTPGRKRLALLTIDDAPSPDLQHKLSCLKERSITAILFCQGNNLAQYPEAVIQAIEQGHLIGNHGFSHKPFAQLSLAAAKEEIQKTEELIEQSYTQAGIARPAKVFRFPYGNKGDRKPANQKHAQALQTFLQECGFVPPNLPHLTSNYYQSAGTPHDVDWYWTFDAMEYGIGRDHNLQDIDDVYRRMDTDNPTDGIEINEGTSDEIILVHDHAQTTKLFPAILDRLLSKKLQFISPQSSLPPMAQ